MEHWIIHYDAHYDAVRWPFDAPWEQFVREPRELVHACDDFGRAAVCDGLSETPSVPPHLPRLLPRGRYRMAIYHDDANLYVVLAAQNGPILIDADRLAAIPHMRGVMATQPMLVVMTADQTRYLRFGFDGAGNRSVLEQAMLYGPRRREPAPRDVDADIVVTCAGETEYTCWRVARASVHDAFVGNTLRLSVMRMDLPSHEAVAWGSHTVWAPRPDEMVTVALVEERTQRTWPIPRRVELHYDPAREQGSFRVLWDGIYETHETGEGLPRSPIPQEDWHRFSLRFNNQEQAHALAHETNSETFAIRDGVNRLELATVGGPLTAINFEKCSGNRIAESSLPSATERDRAWLLGPLRAERDRALEQFTAWQAEGAARRFQIWEPYRAASLARLHHYLDADERIPGVLQAEADYLLSLQRPDGSFAGFHLEHLGATPKPWAGGAYDSGQAGELWVVAAWLLEDERYLDASRRLIDAYQHYRIEFNYNYAAFTLFHLATHYRLTREPAALEQALYYCQNCVAIDLLPLGFHAGHNYYTCYASITLRGMGHLCAVLPDGHPYKPVLRDKCVRMSNQLIARLQADGRFDARNRYALGFRHGSNGLYSVAFLVGRDDARRIDAVVQRQLEGSQVEPGKTVFDHLLDSDLIRYIACREKLLAGEPIDLMAMV